MTNVKLDVGHKDGSRGAAGEQEGRKGISINTRKALEVGTALGGFRRNHKRRACGELGNTFQ